MTRKEETTELIYKDESYAIMGACFEVYKNKGCGFHNPFITSAWKLSWSSKGFHFFQNHRKPCNIAIALRFKKSE